MGMKALMCLVLGLVLVTKTSFASGKFMLEPVQEMGKEGVEAKMKVGLSIYEKMAGPLYLVSYTGFAQGIESGVVSYGFQKLGGAIHVGNNLQLELGGILSKDLDSKYDYTQQLLYGKVSVQLW